MFLNLRLICVAAFASVQTLKLRYLRINDLSFKGPASDDRALSELLMLCPELCVLLFERGNRIPDRVLQTLSKFCSKIQVAFLMDILNDDFTPETLHALQEAVCKEDQYLEDFCIVTREEKIPVLKQAAPLFSYSNPDAYPAIPGRFSLCHPGMRKFLGLDF